MTCQFSIGVVTNKDTIGVKTAAEIYAFIFLGPDFQISGHGWDHASSAAERNPWDHVSSAADRNLWDYVMPAQLQK